MAPKNKSFWKIRFGVAILIIVISVGGLIVAKLIPTHRLQKGMTLNKSFHAASPDAIPSSVTIASPSDSQHINVHFEETGFGSFLAFGTSSGVWQSKLKIYVLMHPASPYAPEWWAQSPVILSSNGWWRAKVWYGYEESPPQIGNTIDLMAIVVNPKLVPKDIWPSGKVPDLGSLHPIAQSGVIHLTIGAIH
ncbi:hypothetical protein L0337_28750 [candidate division KSB1 bacterium]|nr:hypothetical protein [candidate division KSB1 bacterium]